MIHKQERWTQDWKFSQRYVDEKCTAHLMIYKIIDPVGLRLMFWSHVLNDFYTPDQARIWLKKTILSHLRKYE